MTPGPAPQLIGFQRGFAQRLAVSFTGLVWALVCCLASGASAAEERNNLALGKPVTASTERRTKTKAVEAVDGNEFQGSRWVSDHPRDGSREHTQWLAVDLEQTHTIDKVRVLWQRSRWAVDYEIQVSEDGQTWRSVWSVKDAQANSWRHEIEFDPTPARHVRLYCTRTAESIRTPMGETEFVNMYSVIEFEAYAAGTSWDPLRFSGPSTGKPVTASFKRNNEYNYPPQVNDGLMTTFWAARPVTEPHWIALDLESAATLKNVTLHWHRTPAKYTLEVSDDETNWKTIATQAEMQIEPVDDEEVKETHRVDLPAMPKGRYIRVAIAGPPKSPEHTSYILQELIVDFEQ